MNTFFTSDTHFGHANIVRYTRRPQLQDGDLITLDGKEHWRSRDIAEQRCEEMDNFLVEKWNSVVTPNDIVYHLGDFAFKNSATYLRRINFKKLFFVWGNHDKDMARFQVSNGNKPIIRWLDKEIIFCNKLKETYIHGQDITLCHYSMRTWNCSHRGAWQLYGHSHGTLPDDPNSLSIDVGVDVHDYRPVAFEEVSIYMSKKTFKPIDHHGT